MHVIMMTHMCTPRSSDWFFFQPPPIVEQAAKKAATPADTAQPLPPASVRASPPKKRTPPEKDFRAPKKKARTAHVPKAVQADDDSDDTQRRRSGGRGIIPEFRDARKIDSHDIDLRMKQNTWTVDNPPAPRPGPGPWTEKQVEDHNMAGAKLDWLMGKYSTMSSCVPRCYHENCNATLIYYIYSHDRRHVQDATCQKRDGPDGCNAGRINHLFQASQTFGCAGFESSSRLRQASQTYRVGRFDSSSRLRRAAC